MINVVLSDCVLFGGKRVHTIFYAQLVIKFFSEHVFCFFCEMMPFLYCFDIFLSIKVSCDGSMHVTCTIIYG